MTSGDEPMLPHPTDENAPMISGRGTKVIADARGAYVVGNLGGIIYHLNSNQRLQFQKTIVRAGLSLFARIAPNHREIPLFDNIVQEIDRWLLQPGPKQPSPAAQLLVDRGINGPGVRGFWDDYFVLWTLTNLINYGERIDDLTSMAGAVLEMAAGGSIVNPVYVEDTSGLSQSLRQWFLEVAWAILQNREPPPFPETTS
jgi:hypothetical protein